MYEQIRFNNLNDLSRLPYFDVDKGDRLVVSDKSIGKAIDVHTHLALAFVLPNKVDLHKLHPQTEHYLPSCQAIDMDVYSNKNFTPAQLKALKTDLTIMSLTGRGMRATHTIPNLTREMDELLITQSVILPIDLRIPSNNARTALTATKGNGRAICFGSVHPGKKDVVHRIDEQIAMGARGFKLHPNVQNIYPDDPRAMMFYQLCGRRNVPILVHCGPVGIDTHGARKRTQVPLYEMPIRENPNTTFILGHAGALQADLALDLQRRYKNVILETSSQGLSALHNILKHGDPDRIVLGSDWPFYHQAIPLAKILLLTEDDKKLRSKILYDNAARLFQV